LNIAGWSIGGGEVAPGDLDVRRMRWLEWSNDTGVQLVGRVVRVFDEEVEYWRRPILRYLVKLVPEPRYNAWWVLLTYVIQF
jgi:hypothetical protein